MTYDEGIRLVAMLGTYFRQDISKETAALWADALLPYSFTDGVEAVQVQGQFARFMPSLKDLVETVRECQRDRTPALPELDDGEYCTFTEFLERNPEWAERRAALRVETLLEHTT